MTDPVVAMFDALVQAHRAQGGSTIAGTLRAGAPEYAEWKELADGFLEAGRAWFKNTKVRDLGTIAAQIASAHTKANWAPANGVSSPEHIREVALFAWRPAIQALLEAEAARVKAERAEQARAA